MDTIELRNQLVERELGLIITNASIVTYRFAIMSPDLTFVNKIYDKQYQV